ncbi:hypothetical protein CHLRE_14g634279v5 [Chlamydomonas reinhardtii]|uniref:Uncharacterized protein n=1 Tax=Chlamydomonas reinhardtii TaxID=3055 RepID=A0A2K3CYZ3_CHLRE|nr:uncharacterized protein CHLRE_14g634279v5 [Chlamydomonas reinhardtii]PNW73505.1 hypothetical protein CHLRE_14g634279v5 [Chlamydomonas reinhardtii]
MPNPCKTQPIRDTWLRCFRSAGSELGERSERPRGKSSSDSIRLRTVVFSRLSSAFSTDSAS